MICTSWKIKVALNLLKKLFKTLYPIMLITIWEFKKSNHQRHDFDLLALKFELRCVSTGCNVTMVTYYVPKTAISMNALSFMSDCWLFYERHYWSIKVKCWKCWKLLQATVWHLWYKYLVTYKIYSDRHFSFQWSATEWSSWECLRKSVGLQGTQGQDQSIAIWEKYVKFLYNKYYLSFFFARKWFFGSIVFILYGSQGFMPWEGMPRASQYVPTDTFIS